MTMKKNWFYFALLNLFVAAVIGVVLRYAYVAEISWVKYKNLLHAHSHVAMLGWVFPALFVFLTRYFGKKEDSKTYNLLLAGNQIAVLGMLFSFPVQGYGPVSIIFSTLHILLAYIFAFRLYKTLRSDRSFASNLVKTALLFMVISTLGIWAMGGVMAAQMRGSVWYYMSVQFYLHFQFNGWFMFAIMGLFFRQMEVHQVKLSQSLQQSFFVLLIISAVLTYALSVAWSQPYMAVFLINSSGVLIQLLALISFIALVGQSWRTILRPFSGLVQRLFLLAFLALSFKIAIQTLVAFPVLAEAAYTIRNYVIGFIHLILLGAITFSLLGLAFHSQYLKEKGKSGIIGIWTLIAGFVLTELILFLQGTLHWASMGFLPYYYEILFGVSLLLPVGVLFLLVGNKR